MSEKVVVQSRWDRHLLIVVATFLLLLAAGGWGGGCAPSDGSCNTDADCQKEGAKYCVGGACKACSADSHCPTGQHCAAGQCTNVPSEQPPSVENPGKSEQLTEKPGETTSPEKEPSADAGGPDVSNTPDLSGSDDEPLPDKSNPFPNPVCLDPVSCCVPTQLRSIVSGETPVYPSMALQMVLAWSATPAYLVSASADTGIVEIRDGSGSFALKNSWVAHPQGIFAVAINEAGTVIATGSYDREVKLWQVSDGKLLFTLKGHTSTIGGLAFSKDGKQLASTGTYDRSIYLWDTTTGKSIRKATTASNAWGIAFHPNGTMLAVSLDNYTVSLVNTADGKEIRNLKGPTTYVRSVTFSPNGQMVAGASYDRAVYVWNTADGKVAATLKGHTGNVYDAQFSPDGKMIASSSSDRTLRVWQISGAKELHNLSPHQGNVSRVAWSADGTQVISSAEDQVLRLWTLSTGAVKEIANTHVDVKAGLAIHPDGTHIAVSMAREMTAQVLQLDTQKPLFSLQGHTGAISEIAYSPDGKWLATSSWDKTVRLWVALDGKAARTLQGHTGEVHSVAFSADSMQVASASTDRTVRVWNVADGKLIRSLRGHTGPIFSVAFSGDGKWIASASADGTVRIWSTTDGTLAQTLKNHIGGAYALAFSPDSQRIVTGGWERIIRVWKVQDGSLERSWTAHGSLIRGLAFHPNGKEIASVSYDLWVRVWNVDTGFRLFYKGTHNQMVTNVTYHPKLPWLFSHGWDAVVRLWRLDEAPTSYKLPAKPKGLAISPDNLWLAVPLDDKRVAIVSSVDGKVARYLEGHEEPVSSVAFHPNGNLVASASDDKTVRVWRVTDGTLLHTLKDHEERVHSVAFSADGKWLASASWDETVRTWQMPDAKPGPVFKGAQGQLFTVAFSNNGKMIATGSYSKSIFVWNFDDGKLLYELKGHTGGVTALAFAPGDTYLYSTSFDSTVKYWRLSDGVVVRTYVGLEAPTLSLSIRYDGIYLAAGSRDGSIVAWHRDDAANRFTITSHTSPVVGLVYGGDGFLYSASEDQSIRRWKWPSLRFVGGIAVNSSPFGVSSLAVSGDGNTVLSGGEAGRVRVLNGTSGSFIRYLYGFPTGTSARALAISANGLNAAGAGDSASIYAWKVDNGTRLYTLASGYTKGVSALALTPDGFTLISAGVEEPTLKQWNLKDGKENGSIPGHTGRVIRLAFDQQGSLLMSASLDKTVRLWNPAGWASVHTFTENDGEILDADLSGNAKHVAVLVSPNMLKVWNVEGSLHKQQTFQEAPSRVRFGGNGAWMALSFAGGLVRILETSTLRQIQYVRPLDNENLSLDVASSGKAMAVGDVVGSLFLWRCP